MPMVNLVSYSIFSVRSASGRPGSCQSVGELTDAIKSYLATRNLAPKRYVWKASGAEILAKIQRSREALAVVMNT